MSQSGLSPTYIIHLKMKVCDLHAQFVKLSLLELRLVHPAWHGEKYVSPLAPQTGCTSFMSHSHPKLQEAVRLILNGSDALLEKEEQKRKETLLIKNYYNLPDFEGQDVK